MSSGTFDPTIPYHAIVRQTPFYHITGRRLSQWSLYVVNTTTVCDSLYVGLANSVSYAVCVTGL